MTVVPTVIGDAVYDMVASRRYSLFGKTDVCQVPTAAYRARFVEFEAETREKSKGRPE